uniref:Neur_chan_memb domain-containing protein n=1 Tax=Angiostrongylus cantonensis TaxID=6313 RepID=A0A0K0DPX4_ANGCA
LPDKASYVKAIDVWMGACMAFVFSAMIEFTVVNYCTRRKVKKEVSSASGLTEQVHNLVTQYKERQPYQNCTIYEVALYDDNTNVQNLEKKQIREMNRSSLLLKRNLLSDKKRKGVEERLNRVEENRKYAQMIDRRSRFYFPLSFIIFNLFYWVYYINYAADTIE